MTRQIISQYKASLKMLKNTIEACPEELWTLKSKSNTFWHLAYHCLWFTNLYLSKSLEEFEDWPGHRADYQALGPIPHEGNRLPVIGAPYSKDEALGFLEEILSGLDKSVESYPLSNPSGFFWLPFDKLELHLYNLRHIHHHTGQLMQKLKEHTGESVGWVRMDE